MASEKPKYKHRLSKADRLSSKKWIEDLFTKGDQVKSNPLKGLFLINPDLENPQVLISVPKRNFKKASARNLLKRRIREAYRLNRHILKAESGRKPMIGYIYLGTTALSYQEIEIAVIAILKKINLASGS